MEMTDLLYDMRCAGSIQEALQIARHAATQKIDWNQELRDYAGPHYGSMTAEEKENIITWLQDEHFKTLIQ